MNLNVDFRFNEYDEWVGFCDSLLDKCDSTMYFYIGIQHCTKIIDFKILLKCYMEYNNYSSLSLFLKSTFKFEIISYKEINDFLWEFLFDYIFKFVKQDVDELYYKIMKR